MTSQLSFLALALALVFIVSTVLFNDRVCLRNPFPAAPESQPDDVLPPSTRVVQDLQDFREKQVTLAIERFLSRGSNPWGILFGCSPGKEFRLCRPFPPSPLWFIPRLLSDSYPFLEHGYVKAMLSTPIFFYCTRS